MIAQPAGTHLAQLNVGHIRYATDDPRMAEFMGQLDAVNALRWPSAARASSGASRTTPATTPPIFSSAPTRTFSST